MSFSLVKYQSLKRQGEAGQIGWEIEHKFGRDEGIANGVFGAVTPTSLLHLPKTGVKARVKAGGNAEDTTYVGTYTLAANVSDADTVTIGAKVYTYEDELTDVDGNVHIGGTASATLDNLIDAINLGAGAGTDYATSMTANAISTSAIAGAGDTMTLFEDASAAAATTENGAQSSWGAANTVTGAGAQQITIFGLDAGGANVEETISLRGALVSQETTTFWKRLYCAKVTVSGEYSTAVTAVGGNTANIDIETSGGTAWMQILANEGQTQHAAFTVPLDWTGYLKSVSLTVDSDTAKDADLRLMVREDILNVSPRLGSKNIKLYWDGVAGTSQLKPDTPILELPELSDIWVEASGAGAGTEASACFEIELFNTPVNSTILTQSILDRYTSLTDTQTTAITTLINQLVADGNYVGIDELFLLNIGSSNSLIGINGTVATLINTPTFSDGGMLTNGSDNALDTTIIPSSGLTKASLNDIDVQCFLTENLDAGTNKMLFGASVGVNIIEFGQQSTPRLFYIVNSTAANIYTSGELMQNQRLYGLRRDESANHEVLEDGIVVDTSAKNSTGLSAGSITVGALKDDGVIMNHMNVKTAIFKIGASVGFSPSLFNTAIRTYLTTTGAI